MLNSRLPYQKLSDDDFRKVISYEEFFRDVNGVFLEWNVLLQRIKVEESFAELFSDLFEIAGLENVRQFVLSLVVAAYVDELNGGLLEHVGEWTDLMFPFSLFSAMQVEFKKYVTKENMLIAMNFSKNIARSDLVEMLTSNDDIGVSMQEDISLIFSFDELKYKCTRAKENFVKYDDMIVEYVPGVTPRMTHYRPSKRRYHYNGQLKLYYSLSSFLEWCGDDIDVLIYVGAAPGYNIAAIACVYPNIKFYLNDIKKLSIEETENVFFFDLLDEVSYDNYRTAFYSDIYSGGDYDYNYEQQIEYARSVDARYNSLKYRLKYYGMLKKVVGSRLRTQVCGKVNSNELREWFVGPFEVGEISASQLEGFVGYYNYHTRAGVMKFPSVLSGCACYDCIMLGNIFICDFGRIVETKKDEFALKFSFCYNHPKAEEDVPVGQGVCDFLGNEIAMRGENRVRWMDRSYWFDRDDNYFICPPLRLNYVGNDIVSFAYLMNFSSYDEIIGDDVYIACPRCLVDGYPPGVACAIACELGRDVHVGCECYSEYRCPDEAGFLMDTKGDSVVSQKDDYS